MSKIFEISKLKTKEEKLEKIREMLTDIQDELDDVISAYEKSGDEESVDALTEALDALIDANEIIQEM